VTFFPHHLRLERAAHPALTAELAALLQAIALAGKVVAWEVARAGLTGRLGETGEINVQGEWVKKLDAWANGAVVDVLRRSGLVSALVSEEMAEPLVVAEHAEGYVVCLDPVDGSLNADINGIVGTIFGIRPGRPATGADAAAAALGPGTTQVAAGYIMYGPATVLAYTAGHGVHGFTLDTTTGEYVLTHPAIRMPLDLTVDGADEVDPPLNLIKGYGGALVRERIVAAASRRQVILVTVDKLVPPLGARGRLPVEIVPFGRPLCERRLAALGCRPGLRGADGGPFVTDNGNLILDCEIAPLEDPAALEREIRRIPGVVDTGLFLGTADTVLVAEAGTVRVLSP